MASRALVVLALLAGAAGEPRLVSSQAGPDPYRMVRPPGDGPHPALLFVSGCSGGDILTAVAYARSSPLIQASDISVIGWSMGGGGVLSAIARLPVDAPSPFRAAVAYYPECYGVTMPL